MVRGYYGDVRAGSLDGAKVRVKRLFTSSDGADQKYPKVCHPYYNFPMSVDTGKPKPAEFLRRGCIMEALGTPKHRSPQGYYYYSPSPINL